jgi:hypothetical protein
MLKSCMKRALIATLTSVAALGIARPASAQSALPGAPEAQYSFEKQTLVTDDAGVRSVVDIGCEGRAALRFGNKLLVACGPRGVIQIDFSDPASPRREGTMHVVGDANGLFLHDGAPWVEVSHVDAQPVQIEAQPSAPWSLAGTAPLSMQREPEQASKEQTSAPSLMAPPRQSNLWDLTFATAAFVTFGTIGAGVLGSTSLAYRFEGPFVVRAEVAPFGIAGPSNNSTTSGLMAIGTGPSNGGTVPTGSTNPSSGGTVITAAAHLLVGIDTQFIEVALGIGSATVNQNLGSPSGQPDSSALSIAESARIGARDGLALNFESTAVAANRQFNLGYFVASAQIPLSRKIMLVLRGGGGPVGFAYGDIGVRDVIRGDGGKGTVALTGFAGGASIMVDLCSTNPVGPFTTNCNNASLSGPSLGGGVDWKF